MLRVMSRVTRYKTWKLGPPTRRLTKMADRLLIGGYG
jgi:hypothetical protein